MAEKVLKRVLKTLEKNSKSILLFFIFILFSQTILAEENITITAEVQEKTTMNWLYSEHTKQTIIGSTVTLSTILTGLGIYYLVKIL